MLHFKKGMVAGGRKSVAPEPLERRLLMSAADPVTLQFENVASLGGVVGRQGQRRLHRLGLRRLR
jgi:hypothetical protein